MKAAAQAVAAASNSGSARTVIYCHGMSDKPPEKPLRSEWDQALFGPDQGERTRMAYWLDCARYPEKKSQGAKAWAVAGGPAAPSVEVMLTASIADSDERARPGIDGNLSGADGAG